ncbi:MAG TPA: UDP-N-acetylmuramoyl-tripeptide--D-alanyl-D-alanine ligase [Candidatus Paceibacterota bacterium]
MKNIFKKTVVTILTLEARFMLRRHKPKIIAVTGSVGKTSSKDLIYSVVSTTFSTRKSEKSYNSEFGVPLTILNLKTAWSSSSGWISNLCLGLLNLLLQYKYPEYLILEIGADHPGDIKTLVSYLHPKIGVVTGLGNEVPVHTEFFGSIEDLIKEKSELLRALSSDGMAILNRDDVRVWELREVTESKVVSFGFTTDATIRGDNFHTSYDELGIPKGISQRVDYQGKSVPIRLSGVLGKGHAYSALSAFAVGVSLGMNVLEVADALGRHVFTPGRMCILTGINGSTLIDDTYNSSPTAVKLALETLHEIEGAKRKIAVLGDMLELGEYSESEHKKVGGWVRGVADVLVCVGPNAKIIGESALSDGCEKRQVHFFLNSIEAGNYLRTFVRTGDVVLLKASQSIRLEKATEMLLEDPSKAKELLVRQESEWKNR